MGSWAKRKGEKEPSGERSLQKHRKGGGRERCGHRRNDVAEEERGRKDRGKMGMRGGKCHFTSNFILHIHEILHTFKNAFIDFPTTVIQHRMLCFHRI